MATDEEALAAEWETVADESAPAIEQSSEPVLNQAEINSLLGTDDLEDEISGIQAIVDSAMVSYERLPMLEIVFDRLLRMMSTSLRNLTSDNVEVSLDSITSISCLLYTSPSPRDGLLSRMPSSA